MRKAPARSLDGPGVGPAVDLEGSAGLSEQSQGRRFLVDLLGVLLLAALAGWTAIAAAAAGGDSGPIVGLVVLSGSSLLAARAIGSLGRWIVPGMVVVSAAVLAVLTADDIARGPLGGPFGYANATGAFYAQASIAGLMLAMERRWVTRVVGWVAALSSAGLVVGSGSMAATVVLLVVATASLTAAAIRRTRGVVVLAGLLVAAAVVLTAAVGASYESGSGTLDRAAEATVGARRAALWHDAIEIMVDHPGVGAGAGSFRTLSPTARADVDAQWAHNEFLELGAETGIAGIVLLLLLFAWGFARLWLASPGAAIALGAAALVALGVHSTIDYVMHFPAIPITAAALLGTTTAE